jgi:hypothetical protein
MKKFLINLHPRPASWPRSVALRGHVIAIIVVRLLASVWAFSALWTQDVVLEAFPVVQSAPDGDDDGDDEEDDCYDGEDC